MNNPVAMPAHFGYELCSHEEAESFHKARRAVNCEEEITLEEYFKRLKATPMADDKDMVNSPSHYTQGGIETIDYIEAKLTPEEFKGYLKGNIIKYTSRAGLKDEVKQEFAKAQWYIKKLIDSLE